MEMPPKPSNSRDGETLRASRAPSGALGHVTPTREEPPPLGCGKYPHRGCGCDCDRPAPLADHRGGAPSAPERNRRESSGATRLRPKSREKPRGALPPHSRELPRVAPGDLGGQQGLEQKKPPAAGPQAFPRGAPHAPLLAPLPALWAALSEWHAALASWAGAMRAYARELDAENRKTLGGRWMEARAAVENSANAYARALGRLGAELPVEKEEGRLWPLKWPRGATKSDLESLGALPPSLSPGGAEPRPARATEDYPRLMTLGDAMEQVGREFLAASAALTDPAVRAAAGAGMSRSYAETLQDLTSAIGALIDRVRRLQSRAVRRAAAAGACFGAEMTAAEIAGPYDRGGHSALATSMFLGALMCGAKRSLAGLAGADRAPAEWALARLDGAKDQAFGLARDGERAIAADTASLGEYHPAQAMTYFPRPGAGALDGPEAAAGPPELPTVDLTLPGTRLGVVADPGPLIDRARAAEFGPLAGAASGLNYRLVERLRTIAARPLAHHEIPESGASRRAPGGPRGAALPSLALAGQALPLTGDAGRTVRRVTQPTEWAPGAGCRPRQLRLGMAEEAVILGVIRAERLAGWGLSLQERYEAAAAQSRLPNGACDQRADSLVAGLVASLDRAYEESPPEDVRGFLDLALGHGLDPAGCVASAVSGHGWAIVSLRLQAEVAAIGAPWVPYATLSRETLAAELVDSLKASQEMWKRLRGHLHVSAEAFGLPEPQRKLTLLQDFRRAAIRALQEGPVDCAPVTPAFFAASRVL